jgi:hypothetical protein
VGGLGGHITREAQFSARYLGLQFQQDGRWNEQLAITISRSRVALGRCKIMARTIGTGNVRHLVNLFDATFSSIFCYGLGVWGVLCAQVTKLDDLFVEFIRWLFRLPPKTGKLAILGTFARRHCCHWTLPALRIPVRKITYKQFLITSKAQNANFRKETTVFSDENRTGNTTN